MAERASRDFDKLFNAEYVKLARLLYRVTGDTGRAEEAASEAFWRLYHKPPVSAGNIEGWLYRTGVRLALDQIKKDRRRTQYETLGAFFKRPASPEQALERTEERARVRRALLKLKTEQVALILLRADGLSYAELAERLGINPASVGSLLGRAQEALQKEYENRYGKP